MYSWNVKMAQHMKTISVIPHINRIKGKNHVIASIDAKNVCNKIQHPFTIKTLNKVGRDGSYFSMIKSLYDMPTANIILDGEGWKASPLRSGTNRGCLLTFITSS